MGVRFGHFVATLLSLAASHLSVADKVIILFLCVDGTITVNCVV